jgi:ABC-2 type transport system permease protein
MDNYNNFTALKSIAKASLLAIVKTPQTIIFSLFFPLIFVFIFGAFGDGGAINYKIAMAPTSDTNNVLYAQIKASPFFNVKSFVETKDGKTVLDTVKMRTELEKGNLAAILNILPNQDSSQFIVNLKSTNASAPEIAQVIPLIENIATKIQKSLNPNDQPLAKIIPEIYSVREFHQIDFVLPGQIGFSILFSTLFGIAFTFYNLREQLVLKRFYATPVNRLNILLGIGFSRIIFQLLNVVVLILVGHYFLDFTLAHGISTFLQMVLLSFILLMILMGVGLIFSSIVKSDSSIPLLINIFSLPQMLLGGTFFSIAVFPKWMQNLCQVLPLTHFNIAMRKISFNGSSLIDCWPQLGVLFIWMAIVYVIVYKVFKWE